MKAAETTASQHRHRRALRDVHPLVPWLFMLPHAVLFFVFIVYPVAYGVFIGVHRWDPLDAAQPFVGLRYFLRLFDPSAQQAQMFWASVANTAFFVLISTPTLIAVSLCLALQLHSPILGRGFFRAVFFMPGILSVTVVGVLWRWMFENNNGLINIALGSFGVMSVSFITTEGLSWIPILVATVWWSVGFTMTIYLAALTNIPQSLYEAADLDGAGGWAKFFFITWPSLAPTTLFVLVTTVLSGFQLFGQSQLITGGGPTRSTRSAVMYIAEEAFSNNQFSSAVAMGFVLGLVMLGFTILQFRSMARNVTEVTR